MPITQSAKKAYRQSIRRRVGNLVKMKAFKEALKAYKKAPSAELLSKAYQQLDKAAKVNVIKKNKASRLKSRLTKLLRTPASRS